MDPCKKSIKQSIWYFFQVSLFASADDLQNVATLENWLKQTPEKKANIWCVHKEHIAGNAIFHLSAHFPRLKLKYYK